MVLGLAPKVSSLFSVLLIFSWSAQAETWVSVSADPSKSLVISDEGGVTYTSASGSFNGQLATDGFHLGDVTLAVEPAENGVFTLRVIDGTGEVAEAIEIGEDGTLVGGDVSPDLIAALVAFAETPQGQLLLEAGSSMPQREVGVTLGNPLDPYPVDSGLLNCVGNLLNVVAAASAMVGGCGTPACGPAYRWCCASGVAWYVSGLIGTASSCRLATW